MQTFLPYPDFHESARCLDRQRLGKQRVEALQILRTIAGITRGWCNHPAVRMWRSSPLRLAEYALVICDEWIERGYRDTCRDQVAHLLLHASFFNSIRCPSWLGDSDFHRAHRSNLLRKNPEWYSQFGWDVPNDLPYIWPM